MTRIAFFEPSYVRENARDWEIRGSYKYPSLLGDLHERAEIRLLMAEPPPAADPHRRRLEAEFGVSFHAIDSLEDARWPAARILTRDYAAAIAEHAPDIVSTLNGRMIGFNYALARAARRTGTDFVYRIAGNDIATQVAVQEAEERPVAGTSLWGTLAAQEGCAVEAARTVIVMSATERDRIARLASDPDKIRICRRGVDRSHFAPPPQPPERCTRFLFVGRDSAEKGIDLIEAAANKLAQSHPEIRFTIAGDFAEREVGNRRYLGFRDYERLPELYRGHDALVLPARSEGFPQVVMEAMSCGLPAVLSHHLFARDFAERGEGVALVKLTPKHVARPIAAWHGDPALFRKVREEALAHAAAHFDETANRPLYHRVLLAEDRKQGPAPARPSFLPMRRYWIVTGDGIEALAALRDPPHWGRSVLPLTLFLTEPRQKKLFRDAEGAFELVDASEALVPALVERLEGESARYVQIATDPIEDFPAAIELLAERLETSDAQAVRTGWLAIGRDQRWSGDTGESEPVWIDSVALREALSGLDADADLAEIRDVCARMLPARILLPAPAAVLIGSRGDVEPSPEALARARIAGAAAEMDWREVRVRVRLDRADAKAARAAREEDRRATVLEREFERLQQALGWAARLRAKLTRRRR